MTFPATLTLVTVTGQFDVPPDGGAAGWVRFIADRPLQGSSIVPPFERIATLDTTGAFSIQLPATNDPQWSPSGWAYRVEVSVSGSVFSGTLQLDYLTTSVTLAPLFQPAGAAVTGTTYILLSQRSVAGGVAGLDSDGDVINAAGEKVGEAAGGGIPETIINAKGDLIAGTANDTAARVAVGTNGQYLKADSAQTAGVAWDTLTASDVSDSTTVGRAVLTAADAAAGRTAISAASTTHASSHADGGSDEISVDASQITSGSVAIGRLPTGTSDSTVALGNAPAGAVTTHEAASDPHPQYAVMYYSTGSGYTAQNGAAVYVGPDDPGSVANGSIWIDTDA